MTIGLLLTGAHMDCCAFAGVRPIVTASRAKESKQRETFKFIRNPPDTTPFLDGAGKQPSVSQPFKKIEPRHGGRPNRIAKRRRTYMILAFSGNEDNIKGNDYRLVGAIDYQREIVFIKWLGTHKEYDRIDVGTVQYAHKTHQK